MNESVNYIFEIIEAELSQGYWIVAGLAFETITKNDVLYLQQTETSFIKLHLKEIIFYGKPIDQITRGLTARLVLELDSESGLKLPESGYLYKLYGYISV